MARRKGIVRELLRVTNVLTTKGLEGGLLAEADKARDARRWADAAVLYGRLLATEPVNAQILVQYGHALKESGDIEAGLNAYLRAIEVDPINSDTALHIGHAAKLLGRRLEAIEWYGRAALWPPAQADAFKELRALNAVDSDLAPLLRKVDDTLAKPARTLWHVLWPASAKGAGNSAVVRAWNKKLMTELERRGVAAPLERVDNNGSLTTTHNAVVVITIPDLFALDTPPLDRATDVILEDRRIVLVLYLPEAARSHSGDCPEFRVRATYLDALLERSNLILTDTALDAEILRAWLHSRNLVRDVEPLGLLRTLTRRTPGDHMTAGPDIALLPSCANLTRSLVEMHRQIQPEGSLVFVSSGDTTPPGMEGAAIVDEVEGLALLATARSILVLAGHANAREWVALASDAGAPILAEPSPHLYSLFGAEIDAYVPFAAGLGTAWAAVGQRSTPSNHQLGRWTQSLSARLNGITSQPLGNRGPTFKLGQFYSFASSGDGLALRYGAWAPPEVHGSEVLSEGAQLMIARPFLALGTMRFTILAATSAPGRVQFSIEATRGSRTSTVTTSLPGEGWGWLSIDIEMQDLCSDVVNILVRPRVTDGDQLVDASIYIGGLIAYPVDEDKLWFEFLDRASSGKVPVLRRLRQWAQAQAHAVE